jgi:hypothetical protein
MLTYINARCKVSITFPMFKRQSTIQVQGKARRPQTRLVLVQCLNAADLITARPLPAAEAGVAAAALQICCSL